jgi:RNA polymerase sigma factor (sigma-70 family)
VPAGQGEEAAAAMLELFPEGYAEASEDDLIELTAFTDAEDEVAARLDAQARGPELQRAIAALPRRQRSAVEMRVLEEASYLAIAQRLGCSETAARIRVHRGLASLRSQLGATP